MPARRQRHARPAPQWTRQRMLVLLIGAMFAGVVALLGLGLAVSDALRPHSGPSHADSPRSAPTDRQRPSPPGTAARADAAGDQRDAIANAPMPDVGDGAARPALPASAPPHDPMSLPASTRLGPAGVPTGFPRTREGAVAQLAAIDQGVFESASYERAVAVIQAWAQPGGPTAATWTTLRGLVRLLTAAHPDGATPVAVVLTPLMGLIKGTIDDAAGRLDFVVPCLDFELDVTLNRTARSAVADCQRMQWSADDGGRWMIAPGREPAEAPAVWPGTDLSFHVGYRFLRAEPSDG